MPGACTRFSLFEASVPQTTLQCSSAHMTGVGNQLHTLQTCKGPRCPLLLDNEQQTHVNLPCSFEKGASLLIFWIIITQLRSDLSWFCANLRTSSFLCLFVCSLFTSNLSFFNSVLSVAVSPFLQFLSWWSGTKSRESVESVRKCSHTSKRLVLL